MTSPLGRAVVAAGTLMITSAAAAQTLEPVFSSSLVVNGATTSRDGRLFLPAQPAEPGATPQLVEVRDGKAVAYPDERWNLWKPGMDGHDRFVGVNRSASAPMVRSGWLIAVVRASASRP